MSNAKASILNKLKQQVAGADTDKLPMEQPYQYPALSPADKIALFVNHLEKNQAQVIKLDRANISEVINQELNARDIDQLLYAPKGQYAKDIAPCATNIKLTPYDFEFSANKERLFYQTPAAVTGSRCAIAHTGTIVLWPSIEEPRTLSLVPPVHFVIVDAQTLYQTFDEVIAQQQWKNGLPTNVVLVSGPSKTADIQQTLAYGAHGPKALIVLLYNTST